MATEISFYLVFTLVVLSHYSVLCEEDLWQSLIDEAKQSGIPQDTLNEAQSVLDDESIQQVAVESLGNGPNSLVGWVEDADDEETNRGNQAPANLPDDEEEEVESPENSPTESPNFAPIEAPEMTPTKAPIDPPVLSPTNIARKIVSIKAPTNAPAPLRAPSPAPLRAPSPAPNAASPKA